MKDIWNKLFVGLHIFSVKVLVYFSLVLFSVLAVLNIFVSTYFSETYAEWSLFRVDNIIVQFVLFILVLIVLLVIEHKISFSDRNSKKILMVLMIFTVLFSSTWVVITHSTPVADRQYVSMIASQFIKGDYSAFHVGNYLYIYPFQLGMVAFVELIYRVAGNDSYQAVQLLNVIAVCVIFYALYRITRRLFCEMTSKMILLLLFGCLCAMFFCTYVYGNLFGLVFASLAIWKELEYLEDRKLRDILISMLCISIGIILKNNYSIVLIAMVIMLGIDFFRKKEWQSILFAVMMIICSMLCTNALNSYYSNRANVRINEGIPKITYAAMGLQDGWFGKGTYNKYTVNTYESANYNNDRASKTGSEKVKEQLAYYFHNPTTALGFFGEKIALQWTEPTYMSIWESNCADNHSQELSGFTESMYVGFRHNLVVGFMNFYQSLVWVCAAFYVIVKRKELSANQMMLGMIIIGGFLFHLIWEAKSQYVIQYFLFALPYAAAGLVEIMKRSQSFLKKHIRQAI